MKRLPWKLLGAALILGVVFDILFFEINMLGINVVLMQLAFTGVTLGLAYTQKQPIPKNAWIAVSFSFLYASTFAIWTSQIGLIMSGIGLCIANFLFILFLLGHHGQFHHPLFVVRDALLEFAGKLLPRLEILSHLSLPGKTQRNTHIMRGILIAIPVLLVFAILFISSDLLLIEHTETLFEKIQDWLSADKIVAHVFLIGFCTLFFLGFYSAAFWKRFESPVLSMLRARHYIESVIILASSAILFFGFILYQAFYLFGGQAAWVSIDGITYSEYAVQGFNELAVVSVLVIGLILSLRYFHTEHTQKHIIILETILLAETFLLIISAWLRMNLYIEQYGYTSARLFGIWFFVVISVLLGLFIYNILRQKLQHTFITQSFLFIGVAMLLFTASAPDALSVRQNIARATETSLYDPTPHLKHVSAEAYPIGTIALSRPLSDVNDLNLSKSQLCEYTTGSTAFRKQYGDDQYFSVMAHFDIVNLQKNWDNQWLNDALSVKYPSGKENYGEKGPDDRYFILKWQTWNYSRSKLPTDYSKKPNTGSYHKSYYSEFREKCGQ